MTKGYIFVPSRSIPPGITPVHYPRALLALIMAVDLVDHHKAGAFDNFITLSLQKSLGGVIFGSGLHPYNGLVVQPLQVVKNRLLFTFAGIVMVGILIIGYTFNAFGYWFI